MPRSTETEKQTTDLGPPAAMPDGRNHVDHQSTAEARERKIHLTPVQIGASAAAAATSAVGASFLGAGGTIAGAAVGSVISTVAGALYASSLERAQERLRQSATVLVRRVPAGGAEPGAVPTQLNERMSDTGATQVAPAGPTPDEAAVPPAGGAAPGGAGAPAGSGPAARRRPTWMFAVIAAAGFAVALLGISSAEALLGHPLSDSRSKGGTSISRVVGGNPAPEEREDDSPKPATTSTPTATESDPDEAPSPTLSPDEELAPSDAPSTTSEDEPAPSQEPEPTGGSEEGGAGGQGSGAVAPSLGRNG